MRSVWNSGWQSFSGDRCAAIRRQTDIFLSRSLRLSKHQPLRADLMVSLFQAMIFGGQFFFFSFQSGSNLSADYFDFLA